MSVLILDGVFYIPSGDIQLIDFRPFTSRKGRTQTRMMFQPYILMKSGGYHFAIDGMKECIRFIRCMDPSAKIKHIKSLMKEGGFDEKGKLVDTFYDILADLLVESNCVFRLGLSYSTENQKKIWRDTKAYSVEPIDAFNNRLSILDGHTVERRGEVRNCDMYCSNVDTGRWVIARSMDENTLLLTSLFVTEGGGTFRPVRSEICAVENVGPLFTERAQEMLSKHEWPPLDGKEHTLYWDCTSKEIDDLEFKRYLELFQ